MQNQPSRFHFSLRAVFIWTTFVALGLAALKYPFIWVGVVVNLAVAYSVVFALISALVNRGDRRLFWATYAATVPAIVLLSQNYFTPLLPQRWMRSFYMAIHATDMVEDGSDVFFMQLVEELCLVVFSAIAAYIIPWLVQRGQKQPQR
jgi:hypothetical protein